MPDGPDVPHDTALRPDRPEDTTGNEIAVVGLAGRFPGAPDADAFWRNLAAGIETIRDLSDEDLDSAGVPREERSRPGYVRRAAWLEEIDRFDAGFFGFTPREAELMDPQQRLFLECAWEAVENAGYDPARAGGRVGVFAGGKMGTYIFNLTSSPDLAGLGTVTLGLGNDIGLLAMRTAFALDVQGPAYFVQTACSTGLVAVHLACRSLLLDECRMALAGSVAIDIPNKAGYVHQQEGILSPDGRVRAFDADAAGTVFGSGLGAVVLKRLDDALADGDRVRAVIKGTATNNDGGHKPNFTAPSVEGQTDVILRALVDAEVSPETISYVEAHGTGTHLGDPVEIRALTKAWRRLTDRTGFCAIGSVKTNVGHLDAAAGMSGLIKTVLALEHGLIPPSLHFREPNPQIDFAATPFRVAAEAEPWERSNGAPRRAAVSAFGFGGTNAHAILEEAPPRPEPAAAGVAPDGDGGRRRLLVLSARSRAALDRAGERLAGHLEEHPEEPLADVSWTLLAGRRTFPWRKAVVAAGPEEAVAALRDPGAASASAGRAESAERPVAFLFSGQGSQHPGMGLGLAAAEPAYRERFDACAEILRPHLAELSAGAASAGGDLRRLLDPEGTEDAAAVLAHTALAQPALFAVEYSLASLLVDRGVEPSALLGHSIGEYVAACLAGVFDVEDALALVAARGRLMAEMPAGSMLALWMGEEAAAEWLRPYDGAVGVAAINGDLRTVVSGPTDAIHDLESRLTLQDHRSRLLITSHAFHSPMMAPAAERFRDEVARVAPRAPERPFVSNLTGTWIRDEEATDPGYWADHLLRPVRFAAGLETIAAEGDPVFLEVGPGNALTTLANAHLAGSRPEGPRQGPRAGAAGPAAVAAMRHPDDPRPDDAVLLGAVGRLFTLGVDLDAPALFADEAAAGRPPRRVPLPGYPFERERYWVDADPSGRAGAGRARMTKEPDLGRWFHLPSWKSALPPAAAGPGDTPFAGRTWWVFTDDSGIGEALAGRLTDAGARVAVIEDRPGRPPVGPAAADAPAGATPARWSVDAGRDEDLRRLVERARELHGRPAGIVHLWSVGDDPPPGSAEAAGDGMPERELFGRWQDRGYYSLLTLAAGLFGEAGPGGTGREGEDEELALLAVSSRLHDVRGDGDATPEKAPLLGACLVIPQEHQQVTCRAADLDAAALADPDATAGLLLAEAAELASPVDGPRDVTVAWRGGRRLVRAYERTPIGPAAPGSGFRDGGVYLITGGLGAVGRVVAGHLARAHRARLVLAGRSELPARDDWDAWCAERGEDDPVRRKIAAVRELEAAGAEVEVASADVTDPEQATRLLDRAAERFGALHGVLHLAGALDGDSIYRPLTAIGRASEEQFGPKAYALYALERAVRAREEAGAPPDFVMLFSSNASVLGGLGFVAYAAANAFVDAFAARRDRPVGRGGGRGEGATRWLATGWDEWPAQAIEVDLETGMSEFAMTADEGGEALERALACGAGGHLVVSTGDLDARLDLWVRRDPALVRRTGTSHARPELDTAYEAPRDPLEEAVAAVWQELLGIETVGVHDNFFDLGGHSLLATQLLSRLRQELGVELELQRLFEGPTVAGVARAAAEAGAVVDGGAAEGTEIRAQGEAPGEEAATEGASGRDGTIPRRGGDPSAPVPLSFAQERMWFLARMDPESAAYNLLTPARLEGRLDLPALARAFNALVARHAVLRTTFAAGEDGPVQTVAAGLRLPLPVVDLSALPEERRKGAALALASRVRAVPFDLERGPMLRVAVARLGPRDHALALVMHHIVSDGWSMGVLLDELVRLTQAFGAGAGVGSPAADLPALPIDYADFAAWQRERLRGEVLERHLAYWREALVDPPPPLRLPTDRPRAAGGAQTFRARAEHIRLEPAAWDRVRALARDAGATPFMVVLAAFQVLLYRLTGEEDLVVGCPIAGRNRREVEGLVGIFLNTLVLRSRVPSDGGRAAGFRDLLARVTEASVGAFSHQDLPLETVLQTLFAERGAAGGDRRSGMSFFQTMFLFQNMPAPALELDDVTLSELRPEARIDLGTAIFDLCLAAEETDGGLALWMTYNGELFEGGTVERMLRSIARLLDAAAEDPDRSIDALPLVSDDERRRLVALGEPSGRSEPGRSGSAGAEAPWAPVHEQVAARAAAEPDRPALLPSPAATEALSYGELMRRAGRIAALLDGLLGAVAGSEARVGLCLERSPALVIGMLGTLRAGAAYVPLDPAYPEARARGIVSDAGARVVLVSAGLEERFAGMEGVQVVAVDPEGGVARPEAVPGQAVERIPEPAPVGPEAAAYVVYTSGSTGMPKGVVVPHRALAHFVAAARECYPIGPDDRVLQFASISFDTSVEEIFPALAAGATLVLRDEQMLAGARAFVEGCGRAGVTVADLPTAWFHEMVHGLEAEGLTVGPPVRLVILGGERVVPERLAAFRRHLDPSVRVLNTYGPTEATVVATASEPLADDPLWSGPVGPEGGSGGEPPEVTIGTPLPGVSAHPVDRRLEPAPPGAFGELALGGPGIARGYLGRPAATAERFVPDPLSGRPGARLYRTGDRARWVEGRGPGPVLEFGGRIDAQLKIRGYRVEPGEIETALEEHPAVRQAVVVARPGAAGGPARLVAYVVPSSAAALAAPAAAALRSFLDERLPAYMVPADVVVLDSLPLTPTGKLDRRGLPDPEPSAGAAAGGAPYVPPETEAEEAVAAVFGAVLGLERVGAEDDFFEIGGHSLLLPQVLHRVREAFGVDVPLRAVYEEPTVAGLAALVEEMILEEIERLEPAE